MKKKINDWPEEFSPAKTRKLQNTPAEVKSASGEDLNLSNITADPGYVIAMLRELVINLDFLNINFDKIIETYIKMLSITSEDEPNFSVVTIDNARIGVGRVREGTNWIEQHVILIENDEQGIVSIRSPSAPNSKDQKTVAQIKMFDLYNDFNRLNK